MTTTIKTGKTPVTWINVFQIDPKNADALVAHQIRDLAAFQTTVPGLVSTNWHLSLDRTRLTNYAQWDSVEAMKTALAEPRFAAHNAEAAALTLGHEGHFYEVVATSADFTQAKA